MKPMVELKNIHKKMGNRDILNGVDLTINEGEVVVILGPSGSGKTTLLRTINFLNPADKGTITVNDRTVDSEHFHAKEELALRRETSMVFQDYGLFRNRTVLKNITEGMITVQKKPKEEAEKIARELLAKVGLSEYENSYPSQLSGGQQQRVGICRAFALNPKVILFDEPTSALDPELVGGVLEIMREVAATGITMIVVTHEIAFARDVADKVVFMDGGKVIEEGSPKEVIEHPKNEATIKFLRSLLGTQPEYVI